MSDKSSCGRKFLRRDYEGEAIRVSFDFKRCLHVAECVRRSREAFDKDRRPWIMPDEANVETIVQAVLACPTGALRYERSDGGRPEAIPGSNTVFVMRDGPLYVRGRIEISDENGDTLHLDTRVALCRCGQSDNKPFCDHSHRKAGFKAPGLQGPVAGLKGKSASGKLCITPRMDASFVVTGPVTILGTAGLSDDMSERTELCRCGSSADKPYCDGSHRRTGFRAPIW